MATDPMKPITVKIVAETGGVILAKSALLSLTPLSVTSSGVTYTITSGKSGCFIQNNGSKTCWFGDSNVDPSTLTGTKLVPSPMIIQVDSALSTFSITFKTTNPDTTTISINEF